jgi:hypothetical protein
MSYISSVLEMRRTGILDRIRKTSWPQVLEDDSHGKTVATISHLILAVGTGLSIFLLVLERIWWKTSVQSRNKNPDPSDDRDVTERQIR